MDDLVGWMIRRVETGHDKIMVLKAHGGKRRDGRRGGRNAGMPSRQRVENSGASRARAQNTGVGR